MLDGMPVTARLLGADGQKFRTHSANRSGLCDPIRLLIEGPRAR